MRECEAHTDVWRFKKKKTPPQAVSSKNVYAILRARCELSSAAAAERVFLRTQTDPRRRRDCAVADDRGLGHWVNRETHAFAIWRAYELTRIRDTYMFE